MTQLPMEPQASVVREIISRVAQGQGILPIIRELEGRGVRAPRGGPRWSWSVVHDIVRNPAYIGKTTADEEERVAWAPLVPERLFFDAQRSLSGSDDPPRADPPRAYPALSLLLCAAGSGYGMAAGCLQLVT
ncbi:recombinase family protein [Spirillospora sp. NPDC000708]